MKKDLIFVIFGSTGDLTARKLIPALTRLYQTNSITNNVGIIALGRRDFSSEEYLNYINELSGNKLDLSILEKLVTYYKMQITTSSDYHNLAAYLNNYKDNNTKVVYYLAVGPELLPIVAKNLNDEKLISRNNLNETMVFEKPFGHDLKSAKAINQMLFSYFDEQQIYRIDHYLGKEVIQNIMTVRFANRLFETVWDRNTIKHVKIVAREEDGILNRAGYYDTSGALKDMVQSHLLQMLSLVAMDAPRTYSSEDIKNEKIKVLKNISFKKDEILVGQYQGYLNEPNIKSDSKTETLSFLKLFVNNERFYGIPFYLLTGKKLGKKQTYIEITFKPTLEQEKWGLPLDCNKLLINVDPLDTVKISFNSKAPGLKENIQTINLTYETPHSATGNIPEAYEKLFLDITMGNRTLFTRWDEIEYSWRLIDQIKQNQNGLQIYSDYQDIIEIINQKYNIKFD